MDSQGSAPGSARLASMNVLVVDDERDVCKGLLLVLKKWGLECTAAYSAAAALEALQHQAFHFVITDVKMPGMQGMELLKEVKQRWPKTVVVVMTGYGTIEKAVEAMRLGAYHFITKPFNNEEILLTLERAVREKSFEEEIDRLHREVERKYSFHNLVSQDRQMRAIFDLIQKIAPSNVPVLIQGESGTGKELIAKAIHYHSLRKDKRFVAVNAGALPDTLLEAELFGYKRGAFTGADRDRKGLLVEASGGTLFLDEIASMSEAFQQKLLRVLQEKEVLPLGATSSLPVDVRTLAAANIDLQEAVKNKEFREDLYYRLDVVTLRLPSLRDRMDDIPLLADHLLQTFCREQAMSAKRLAPAALQILMSYSWPGNVRELENALHRAVLVAEGDEIQPADIVMKGKGSSSLPLSDGLLDLSYEEAKERVVELFQKDYVRQLLESCQGNITHAAARCGITRAALQRIMRKHGLEGRGRESSGVSSLPQPPDCPPGPCPL